MINPRIQYYFLAIYRLLIVSNDLDIAFGNLVFLKDKGNLYFDAWILFKMKER